MDTPTTRERFAALRRKTDRTRNIWMAGAVLPGLLYFLLPPLLVRKGFYSALGPNISFWLGMSFLGLMLVILLGPIRMLSRKAGLSCPKCAHLFEHASFEIVMATRRCGGCGELILKDEGARDAEHRVGADA